MNFSPSKCRDPVAGTRVAKFICTFKLALAEDRITEGFGNPQCREASLRESNVERRLGLRRNVQERCGGGNEGKNIRSKVRLECLGVLDAEEEEEFPFLAHSNSARRR
jgi:hypothetical protein